MKEKIIMNNNNILISNVDYEIGLNSEEVKARIRENKINFTDINSTNSIKEIIKVNMITVFNILNLVLFVLVIISGSYINSLFIGAILSNTFIGIFQEIKAKKVIEKMSILYQTKVNVIRDGKTQAIDKENIVLDDILAITKGMQVPVDATVVKDSVEVDESTLTGEADAIIKEAGDRIYSGSLILQGNALAQTSSVGMDTFINKLTVEAKKYKNNKSKLQIEINKIFNLIAILIIPLTIILFISQLFTVGNFDWKQALLGTTTGVIGMIPEGLVLLTSVVLAAGVIKLSTIDTLTQDLPAIETLARVTVLCLDKTGTLTEKEMTVTDVKYYGNKNKIDDIMSFIVKEDTEQNASSLALKERFDNANTTFSLKKCIPFSSDRKWQAVVVDEGTYVLGAPDVIHFTNISTAALDIKDVTKNGYRILALGYTKNAILEDKLPANLEILSLIIIENKIRKDAKKILQYFREQNVTIKIISGDHPETIRKIATKVGLDDMVISGEELPEDMDKLREVVNIYTLFGRISPEQKKNIVHAMQLNDDTVAMMGDGINDILALKQSDCGISIASGSDATKAVAKFVLLNNDFKALPQVVSEGRKVINNINRVSSIFIVKTVYSFFFSLFIILGHLVFPLEPINLTLLNTFLIGLPSSLLALEVNKKPAEDRLLKNILTNSVPCGLTIAILAFFYTILNQRIMPNTWSKEELATILVLFIGSIQLFALYLSCNLLTKFRVLVISLMGLLFYGVLRLDFVNSILHLAPLRLNLILWVLPILPVPMLFILFLRSKMVKYLEKENNIFEKVLNYDYSFFKKLLTKKQN